MKKSDGRLAWPESDGLTPAQSEINRWLDHFEGLTIIVESVWGCGRLETLVPPDMAEKWGNQIRKLEDAVVADDLPLVRELVEGCARGYAAMQSAAAAAGHLANPPGCWTVRGPSTGREYRVCKTRADALSPVAKGTRSWTLEEVARILEGQELVKVAADRPVGGPIAPVEWFDFKRGDLMP